ncbi:MAG: hypothetical protein HN704_12845 [Bacteroidetes bacterium]|jgi:hypothetical protein|nr:hypothetical protein [Bacteroidota bacterium]MBT6685531.1 hypothetical protein [Bacteroidota bacterium]MBT7144968.1 hypothetical protein [Bacteroidota bacterium]MBT7492482.1 hypothetical protein [Bacteroidota bacterium]
MKSDVYLKIILTVIAINLTIITLQSVSIIPNINANSLEKSNETQPNTSGQNVNTAVDVNIKSIGGFDIYGKLPVIIKNYDTQDRIPVEITHKVPVEIKTWYLEKPLDVKLVDFNRDSRMPVVIKDIDMYKIPVEIVDQPILTRTIQ